MASPLILALDLDSNKAIELASKLDPKDCKLKVGSKLFTASGPSIISYLNNLGFDITTSAEIREDAFLFGESPSRVIVSVREVKEDRFLDILVKSNLSFTLIGHVSKEEIRIDDRSFGDVSEYKEIYNTALAEKLK